MKILFYGVGLGVGLFIGEYIADEVEYWFNK